MVGMKKLRRGTRDTVPIDDDLVDKFGAIIAVELPHGEMGGVKDADREAVFEELAGFGEAFALEGTVDGLPRESGFLG
jgi:hypothetical protein